MLVALGAIDPGSNPGRPTNSIRSCTNTSRDTTHAIFMDLKGLAKLEIFAILIFFFGSFKCFVLFPILLPLILYNFKVISFSSIFLNIFSE